MKCSASHCLQTDPNEPVPCHICKTKWHLSCSDIIESPKKIFVTRNIVFLCNSCIESDPVSPKRKGALVQSSFNTFSGGFSLQKSVSSSSLTEKKQKNKTSDEIKDMKEVVKSLSFEIKQSTSTLAELKNSINTMHQTIQKNDTTVSSLESTMKSVGQNAATYASVTGQTNRPQISGIKTATTTTNVNEPNAVQQARVLDMDTKLAIKGRKLTAGACKITSHSLGSAVKPKNALGTKPERIILPKSIYVSRLETTVTSDDVVNYIKQQIPEINVKHISAHMLVVKDKNLEELTFISFRLRCTDELFEQLRSADFWPEHVSIGDFVDKPRTVQLGDFITSKINTLTNPTVPDNPEQQATTSAQPNSSKNDSAPVGAPMD